MKKHIKRKIKEKQKNNAELLFNFRYKDNLIYYLIYQIEIRFKKEPSI